MGRRRVLHLISSGGLYGAERVVLNLCQASLTGPFSLLLATFFDRREPHLELEEAASRAGVSTRLIACRRRLDLRALRQIRHLLVREQVEILHCHGFKADFYGLVVGRSLGIHLVATHHGWAGSSRIIRWYERVDGLCLRFFDRVVAVSGSKREDLTRAGVSTDRVVVIPHGIHLDHPSPGAEGKLRSELGLGAGERVIGVVARLSPEKGHRHLLEAVRLVLQAEPKTRVLLVGDGPLRTALEGEVRALGLEGSVVFAGFRRDMPEVYAIIDIVVSASLREGFPLSLVEALAAHRPVVATRVGDVPEIVRDGVTGVLVEPGDEGGLARAILGLLRDPARRGALGREGRKLVEERFTADRMARAYAAFYAEVVDESVGRVVTG